MIVLVTGGARSGKSTFAETYAAHLGKAGVYIATAQAFDEEMRERIARHRARRQQSGFLWETVEEPYALADVIRSLQQRDEFKQNQAVVLVDCLIVWLSNWLIRHEQEQAVERTLAQVDELIAALQHFPGTILFVTNEVGDGLVPEYPLGRMFRDLAGLMNQRMAAAADQVFLLTAGIPLEIKSKAFRF
ncbi:MULTISPECIES: bifunctional adenosylcobinamide kinase/adenosylcobinamide-phosphate guanylyltransferase [Brevibacillus]|uniref:Adenosylcobinamide kinase n=1 Tax=Brevibacillus parabrevis TaxID=54914 RepID=A0A4Y3PVY1_BREPA|nr:MULTISPECIES: bifunctional adenosylcobinamide kinase/adenosylcobinamide-phosphate guanylyltransferase [Brevibacillus]RNB93951.1 bifunctional adenosylcobinamide kinase/adenosylcobinamide-phosphate guanylyltransferase [Brevibacillus parabrevis]GEB34681.1 adenosylcobinamide kinase/adenosylcobinamide phosphate guanyltransferase [Brevibacillus parabrevis]HBZ78954.1 bifunctional adenosylcobinamide kinase/adenosylcobinamide-phosphate guanylyltransferase [Brevibacillus sp.]